jgi:predicted PurR-regulated permease PerM
VNDRRAFLVVVAIALLVLWAVRGILAPFIVAIAIAYAFAPIVTSGQARLGWPRPVVIGLGYLIAIAAVVLLLGVGEGRLSHQLADLSAAGPDLVANALRALLNADTVTIAGSTIAVTDIAGAIHGAIDSIAQTPTDAIHIAETAVDLLLQGVLVLIVTFYLLNDAPRLRGWALDLVPEMDRERYGDLLDRIQATLSKWLRGQILLVGLVSVVSYVFLGPVLHVHYALAIGLLTGVLEVIPLVGPLIAAAIAMVAALASGGTTMAIVVGVGYFVIRQLEDQVVMPAVIGRAVHLHPVVTIFAVLAGLSLYGALGGILGVPVAAAANVVFTDVYAARVRPTPIPAPSTPADGLDAHHAD